MRMSVLHRVFQWNGRGVVEAFSILCVQVLQVDGKDDKNLAEEKK